jgi:hypothetical protein
MRDNLMSRRIHHSFRVSNFLPPQNEIHCSLSKTWRRVNLVSSRRAELICHWSVIWTNIIMFCPIYPDYINVALHTFPKVVNWSERHNSTLFYDTTRLSTSFFIRLWYIRNVLSMCTYVLNMAIFNYNLNQKRKLKYV